MEGYDNMPMHSYHLNGHMGHNIMGMSSDMSTRGMLSMESLEHQSEYGVDNFTG